MINISNQPVTNLKRKLDYNFHWYKNFKRISIECFVSHFNEQDELIEGMGINSFVKTLVASTDKVNPLNGTKLTEEQINNEEWIYEYDFYVSVIGVNPVILPQMIESIIALRDLEGKFNI